MIDGYSSRSMRSLRLPPGPRWARRLGARPSVLVVALAVITGAAGGLRWQFGIAWFFAVSLVVLLAACDVKVPDRRAEVDRLTQQIRGMPGVQAVSDEVADCPAQGLVYFTVYVDVADDVSGDQLAAITSRYLVGLRAVDYRGYRAELDARRNGSVFAIDSGRLPVTNGDQILAQARDWAALRHELPGATIALRATITHPGHQFPVQEWGKSGIGSIDLPDPADYRTVTAAVSTMATNFAQLASLNWTISAGKQHPADIKTSRRWPNVHELQVWNKINADQSVAHVDKLTINGRTDAPVWVAEKTTQSRDRSVALHLARQHLPMVAHLPPPVLYTASDQIQGHIGDYGQVTGGPLAVTIGGCTPRDLLLYRPAPAELALINKYEKCRP
jgi:hypothetical protein